MTLSSEKERAELMGKYRLAYTDEADRLIIQDADIISEMLVRMKNYNSIINHKLSSLTEEERAELRETERIIDDNLFDYYFQPIVNTRDGGIYSYEALMRPRSAMKLSPLRVLKYAGLVDRLSDIERETFLNVLSIIDLRKNDFMGKFVFINSIPEAKLSTEDFRRVTKMLLKHSDMAVVEMTEQSEVDDDSLRKLKERYQNMGIRMAIDDYGSGYSNVGNLLRYMPNYVKIDRSLLSDIQDSPKKRHFVREIIQFCHDNDILALAEGVETAEELHTVIMLGADLVQGFFIARPARR
jgi:EAL domain-containing protein (putative c-di-GMP-specific phosphodiesterase class I)